MTPDLDIYRSAQVLVKQHGPDQLTFSFLSDNPET